MQDIIIRKADNEDIEPLAMLIDYLFSIEQDFQINNENAVQGLQLLINDQKKCWVLVAEVENKIVGMVTMQLVISTAEGGYSGLLEDMVIAPDYQGQGIGSKLLIKMEKWAFEQGVSRIQLQADKDNHSALAFYKKNSWQSTSLITLKKFEFVR